MARDTFCFQGLSLRMPMPKPERKNSSPVVTRSHFCEASNSSTAESQMKACSLLWGEGEGGGGRRKVKRRRRRRGRRGLRCNSTMIYIHIYSFQPPSLSFSRSRTPHRVSFSFYQQSLPLLTTQMKSNARWVRARPPLGPPHLKDARLGTT